MYITLYSKNNQLNHPSTFWNAPRPKLRTIPSVFDLLDEIDKIPFFGNFEKVLGADLPLNPWKLEKDVYSLEFEVPRFRKENIKLTVESNVLHLSCEQGDLKLYKSVSIPEDLDVSTLNSSLDHGVLSISAKQFESAKPLQIAIGDAPKAIEEGK